MPVAPPGANHAKMLVLFVYVYCHYDSSIWCWEYLLHFTTASWTHYCHGSENKHMVKQYSFGAFIVQLWS